MLWGVSGILVVSESCFLPLDSPWIRGTVEIEGDIGVLEGVTTAASDAIVLRRRRENLPTVVLEDGSVPIGDAMPRGLYLIFEA